MTDVKARVSTSQGQTIGFFVNPKIENLCEQDYEVSGLFVDESGQPYEKVEFNPQVLPYFVDLSDLQLSGLNMLASGYVQRGRQPVRLTAVKKN